MAPYTRSLPNSPTQISAPQNTLESKWNILFSQQPKEWMAFKPALGLSFYPCYSCRHMFYSKKSFLDHVNRRAVLLVYKCANCHGEVMNFYNRCSFLLHCRKHYSLNKGEIKLNDLVISTLPLGLAGFSRHPEIPYIFDVDEEEISDNTFMNAQFYSPQREDKGKEIVSLNPRHLVINRANPNGESQAFALKQIAKNIPKCKFISLQDLREICRQANVIFERPQEIKSEPSEESINQTEQISFCEEPVTPLQQRNAISMNTISGQNIMSVRILNHSIPPVVQADTSTNNNISTSNMDELVMPVITKVETVEEPLLAQTSRNEPQEPGHLNKKCPECSVYIHGSLSHHFLGANKPEETLRCLTCKMICSTRCSFQAHLRFHLKVGPFVCPDCGLDFSGPDELTAHMDEVCFHTAKSVRFRCPGRRCGKIFASALTFGPHFKLVHIETIYLCGTCQMVFAQLEECKTHCLVHENPEDIVKIFNCSTCSKADMTWHQMKKHVDFHCKDISRCIYIYMCKYCKGYFRSVQTVTAHVKNCKIQKNGVPRRTRKPPANTKNQNVTGYVSIYCLQCRTIFMSPKSKPAYTCNKCLYDSHPSPPVMAPSPEKCVCVLCKTQIPVDQRRHHQLVCKFAKPHIVVERLDLEQLKDQLNNSFSSTSFVSDLDSSHDGSPQKRGDSSDDNRPRKRQKPLRPKRPKDLTAEKPITFDGTYQCRLCDYKNTLRNEFHVHVKTHRQISTAYQCMECGECFVVKPTLIKHLLHFHNVSDVEHYFQENDCFDKGAVNELAKVVKAPYLANNVKTNQCRVCMEEFDDAEAHDKHFRIHGMAFLQKNSV